ncbi:MAG: hypothetical protein K6T81_14565 [Alicyclobacillus macrosporangiidus]|uniref:hypothetical protein n=1 Tax=Alicyclobacillus macrosporangiidus TaxID=392015 RepID=UPI0026F224A9|nr:hypothetical protein [Alicyclobacillus macrosporangiidus]MCL6599937.1 hypothetical protein [Alicyclobacillus macrosporangiidus]
MERLSAAMQEAEQHLVWMMAEEQLSGEYYLAAVVQDSLVFSLHEFAEAHDLLQVAHLAAEMAVRSALRMVGRHRFAVHEAVRGTYHALINLGGDATVMAVPVATGTLRALDGVPAAEGALWSSARPGSQGASPLTADLAAAVVSGLCAAADDLGIDDRRIRSIALHLVSHLGADHLAPGAVWRGESDESAAESCV